MPILFAALCWRGAGQGTPSHLLPAGRGQTESLWPRSSLSDPVFQRSYTYIVIPYLTVFLKVHWSDTNGGTAIAVMGVITMVSVRSLKLAVRPSSLQYNLEIYMYIYVCKEPAKCWGQKQSFYTNPKIVFLAFKYLQLFGEKCCLRDSSHGVLQLLSVTTPSNLFTRWNLNVCYEKRFSLANCKKIWNKV